MDEGREGEPASKPGPRPDPCWIRRKIDGQSQHLEAPRSYTPIPEPLNPKPLKP